MPERADLLILNGTVLTMDNHWTLIPHGGVAVREGAILAIDHADTLRAGFIADETIDAAGCLVLPGLINAHTHAAMTVFRGLADDMPLDTWLKEYIWPAEARAVNPDMVYWGSLLAADEMIRAGVTLFTDMYFFEDHVGRAASDAGMRALLGEALVEFPSPSSRNAAEALNNVRASLERWAGHPLVIATLAPHSAYACSPDTLTQAGRLADDYGVPMLVHCCETLQEIEDVRRQSGRPPIDLLDSLGILSNLVLAHGVHLTDDEIALLAERKVSVVHCPESNMKLASGVARLPDLLRAGVNVALGTDGTASNNDLNVLGELQTAAKLHKVTSGDPTILPARQALWLATRGGAKAFGLDDRLGSLEAGKRADIVLWDVQKPHLIPMFDPYSHLAYAVRPSDVRTVVIEGKVVLRDGQIQTIDEQELFQHIHALAGELHSRWGRDADWRGQVGQ